MRVGLRVIADLLREWEQCTPSWDLLVGEADVRIAHTNESVLSVTWVTS